MVVDHLSRDPDGIGDPALGYPLIVPDRRDDGFLDVGQEELDLRLATGDEETPVHPVLSRFEVFGLLQAIDVVGQRSH